MYKGCRGRSSGIRFQNYQKTTPDIDFSPFFVHVFLIANLTSITVLNGTEKYSNVIIDNCMRLVIFFFFCKVIIQYGDHVVFHFE